MKAVASALQVSGNMSQKLQAMQCGVHELREMTQVCQSIIDAGPASADSDASQQCQRGWHLAKKCSGWANEVQVCYTAAPGHTAVLCCAAPGHMAGLCCAVLCCAVVLFHLSSGHTAGMPSTHSTSYTLGRKQQQQHLCSTGRHVHHIWSQQACSKVVLRRAVSRSASCSVHDCCNAATFIKQSLRFPPICEAVTACLFCR